MSTVQSVHRASVSGAGSGLSPARAKTRAPAAPLVLIGALLVLLLYAAFDHGAASVTAGARIQVVVSALAALAAAGLIWTRELRFRASRRALVALALLAAFAIWSGVTLAWSVSPNDTWIEFNRALTYALVLALAITAGASHARSIEWVTRGFLLVALSVAVYGLGQKLIPGVQVAGLFDLNQTSVLPRLQQPLGYWNALGLFIAMGVPIALAIAVDRAGPGRVRLLALVSTELLLLTLGLTYSRGGVLALVIGLAVGIAVCGARLRSLMWLCLAAVATVPPLAMGLGKHALTTAMVPLGTRETAGAELGGVLLASLAALWLVGSRLLVIEERSRVTPERARRLGNLVVLIAGIVLGCGILGVALSSRGLFGTISHVWDGFTSNKAASNTSPSRLLSLNSGNRWAWWKEALGAFSDRPVGGWGAGSFPVVHLLYRRDVVSVTQAHSVPLQFLAETGIVGAALALGAGWLLLVNAIRAVQSRPAGTGRLLAASLVAAASTYALHSFYDWDWNIPAVTLPALVFAGVLAGAAGRRATAIRPARRALGGGVRGVWLGATTLALCVVALSGALPSLAAGDATEAVVTAARGTPAALASAQDSAELATRLDPLTDAGLLVEATLADDRRQFHVARSDLIEAITRDPTDPLAWAGLANTEVALGSGSAALFALQRELALEPTGASDKTLGPFIELFVTPPTRSATAIPTPK